jgi:hypothetical protein
MPLLLLLPLLLLPLLLLQAQAYKQDPVFFDHLEDQLLDFLGGKAPRLTLKPMPKAQRALVHEYAEHGWGFVSHSSGNEPNRAVQLFKASSSGVWLDREKGAGGGGRGCFRKGIKCRQVV